jgi:hypothetical protein
MKALRPYLLLTRISLAPSAMVDALIGISLGSAGHFPGFPLVLQACLASLFVFLGGMGLNDWADRKADALDRPERPIPAGDISPGMALGFSAILLTLGVVLAFLIHPTAGMCLGAVAACAATYDLVLRGPTLGPLCLAFCRAGNLTFGILAVRSDLGLPWQLALLLPPLAYGFYVGLVSILSGFEDGARSLERGSPHTLLSYAAFVLAIMPFSALAIRPQPASWAYLCGMAISFSAAAGLWRAAQRKDDWTPQAVGQAMGLSLRRLMLATAAIGCTTLNATLFPWIAVGLALAGLAFSHRLRKAFPPS